MRGFPERNKNVPGQGTFRVQAARAALDKVLMQAVQIRVRVPSTFFDWRFTNWRFLVAMFEWLLETLIMDPRPHFSQIRDIFVVVTACFAPNATGWYHESARMARARI